MNKKDYPEEYIKDSVMRSQKMREDLLRAIRAKENMTEASDKSESLMKLIHEFAQKQNKNNQIKDFHNFLLGDVCPKNYENVYKAMNIYSDYFPNYYRDLKTLGKLAKTKVTQVGKEVDWTLSMYNDDAKKEAFKKEMLDDTAKYIKKYGLDKNQSEEDKWMNDRFRHTYGSAIMGIRGGELGALLGGISHEWKPNNPFDEWKMDVWNNKEGRKIARDLKKEYGQALYEMSDEELKDLIASMVVEKMQKNELISDPSDERRHWGIPEEGAYAFQNLFYLATDSGKKLKERLKPKRE